MVHKAVEETRCACFVVSECAKQCEDAHAALACNASTCSDVLAWLVLNVELEPFTAVWVNSALDQLVL